MQTKSKKLTKSGKADALRLKVIAVKAAFGRRVNYTLLYEYEFGKQTAKQLDKIRAVWNLRETDAEITGNLEKISKNQKVA